MRVVRPEGTAGEAEGDSQAPSEEQLGHCGTGQAAGEPPWEPPWTALGKCVLEGGSPLWFPRKPSVQVYLGLGSLHWTAARPSRGWSSEAGAPFLALPVTHCMAVASDLR